MAQPGIDIPTVAAQLGNWESWEVIITVTVAGLLGGLARKLTAKPADGDTLSGDIIVGSIAALAMLWLMPIEQLPRVIGMSVASGFAGKSLLDAFRARAEALAAKQEANQAKSAAADADAKRKEAVRKGLLAVRKAQDLASRSDRVTQALWSPLPGDARRSIAESSPYMFNFDDIEKGPKPLMDTAADELGELETDLERLL